MSRDFVTFSPTRAAYSARVMVVFITLTQIVLLILSINFVLRCYVSRRPCSLLSAISHCESVFFARFQDKVSLLYETTAFSNVTDSVRVSPNNTKFSEGNFISLCWPFECCMF